MNCFDQIILICPVHISGGPEAIHQLFDSLHRNGNQVTIAYQGAGGSMIVEGTQLRVQSPPLNPCLSHYKIYNPVAANGQFDLSQRLLLLFPEMMAVECLKLKGVGRAIWWLSVDNAFFEGSALNNEMVASRLFKEQDITHFAQSAYAQDFLNSKGVMRADLLSDYIVRAGNVRGPKTHKMPGVLYNPKKGAALARRFFDANRQLSAKPLEGMSYEQLQDAYVDHSVYIEFGHSPGKDRMPREAASNHCVVFLRKVGSAAFYDDSPVDPFFLFDERDIDSGDLLRKVLQVLEDSQKFLELQKDYRSAIEKEKSVFDIQVQTLFAKASDVDSKGIVSVPKRDLRSLHIHLASMAPQFMDVRTTLPLQGLGRLPGVRISMSQQRLQLPNLPVFEEKLVMMQRVGIPDLARYKASIRTMVERGWLIVAELDDHPDLLNAVHGRVANDAMWHPLRLAHAVQTSTPALADAFRPYNPKVASFPNDAFRIADVSGRRRRSGKLRIFFGALNRERFSSRIGKILSGTAAQRQNFQFVVVHDRAFFEALGPVDKEFHSALPYESYLTLMESCDIALMPLEGSTGEAYKSDVKFIEASSMGLASLASPVVYGGTIIDGVTGVIVPDVEGWAGALDALAADRGRMLDMASAAQDYVKRRRLFSEQAPSRLAWYHHLWGERIALTRALSARFSEIG